MEQITAVSRPEQLAEIVAPYFTRRDREQVILVTLNGANHVTGVSMVGMGGAKDCPMPVREILTDTLRADAVGFALAHNHPSGELNPSPEDLAMTRELQKAAEIVGLRFLDHLILAEGCRWRSLKEDGHLSP